MAQDFGDDMGNALLNFVTRQAENYLRFGRGRERAFDWWQRHYKKEGNTPEAAKAMAEKQSSREQVVVPFGTSEEAAYYAQVCRENGTYAAAYTDKQGNGFLAFAKEDAKTVAGYAPQFRDVMARLDEQRITDALNHAEPVNKKTMDSLTELTSYPDLPAEDATVIPVTIRYKDAPEETYDVLFSEQDTENLNIDDSIFFSGYSHKELTEMVGRETHEDFDVIAVGAPYKVHATQVKTDAPEKTYDVPGKDAPARSEKVATLRAEDTAIHTQNIRDAAEKAREDCTDFSDFERKMNAQGFGVTETSKGEVMAYEPASLNKDGSVPAYERGRDWPVSAETLKNRYDLNVTHNWFEQNTPKDAGTLPDGDLAMQNARLAQEQMRDEQQLLEPVASDGSMDNDGRTPDPNSGIESHDGADTDSRTAVMDAEQTGSEIRPSDIREEQRYDSESYSLTGEARDMTAAKNQMDTETQAQETTREYGSSLPFNGEDALYSPATDRILIAPRETFRSDEAFTRVLLHEMTHSTGHPSVLARELDTRFGSPSYAEEELVAELGSLFLSADLGIQSTDLEGEFYENHVSYLQSWMNALENDPSYLFKAASKADHADTFIMERYEEELGKNIEIDAPELEEEVSLAGESHDMVSASEHQTESEMPEPALAAIL